MPVFRFLQESSKSSKPRLTNAEIWVKVGICLKLSNYALTNGFTSSNSYVELRAQHKDIVRASRCNL